MVAATIAAEIVLTPIAASLFGRVTCAGLLLNLAAIPLMTVVQVHPDSESMEYHMTVAGPAFAGFSELVTLSTLDVYGEPSEALLEQLGRKVQLLGPANVVVHDLQAGFTRFDPR